jgi:hypothetical protein
MIDAGRRYKELSDTMLKCHLGGGGERKREREDGEQRGLL